MSYLGELTLERAPLLPGIPGTAPLVHSYADRFADGLRYGYAKARQALRFLSNDPQMRSITHRGSMLITLSVLLILIIQEFLPGLYKSKSCARGASYLDSLPPQAFFIGAISAYLGIPILQGVWLFFGGYVETEQQSDLSKKFLQFNHAAMEFGLNLIPAHSYSSEDGFLGSSSIQGFLYIFASYPLWIFIWNAFFSNKEEESSRDKNLCKRFYSLFKEYLVNPLCKYLIHPGQIAMTAADFTSTLAAGFINHVINAMRDENIPKSLQENIINRTSTITFILVMMMNWIILYRRRDYLKDALKGVEHSMHKWRLSTSSFFGVLMALINTEVCFDKKTLTTGPGFRKNGWWHQLLYAVPSALLSGLVFSQSYPDNHIGLIEHVDKSLYRSETSILDSCSARFRKQMRNLVVTIVEQIIPAKFHLVSEQPNLDVRDLNDADAGEITLLTSLDPDSHRPNFFATTQFPVSGSPTQRPQSPSFSDPFVT
jgi:hypothetical protein